MATALPKLRYYYLDKRVKGECVRLALVVGGIEFDDVRCGFLGVVSREYRGGGVSAGRCEVIILRLERKLGADRLLR